MHICMCMHACAPSTPLPLWLPQGVLQRLGPIAAAAAIFLGGYGTGLASSNMYADIKVAEQRGTVSEALVAAPNLKVTVRQTSLTMPDKVRAGA